ncbi:fungal specific transcription factor [Geosmithia morbida]|uniref:Fungal specific transcription factor n=1 Tax=Geosmithia morbida TaxID=1094350 RepID=A0A9P4Z088_9HYPO|nr:fungal specific transcription factor [Geosmithia morbida]KAF4125034.1 fungal specific transcription factor [Geosmithia morbida]
MLRFVSDHVGGIGTKRKQGPKTRSQLFLAPESSVPPRDTSEVQPLSKDAYLRFVGDLSPEASFLTNQRSDAHDATQTSRHADVGVWLGQRPGARQHLSTGEGSAEGNDASTTRNAYDPTIQPSGLTGLQALSSHLRQECLSVLPPDHDLGIIVNLYYAKVDPLFPVMRGEELAGHSPSESVALKQCICLVAAADPKLRSHLRLPCTERLLPPIEFRSYISRAVKQALDMGFVRDRVVLLQVSVLMALNADEANCSEVSAYYVSQAVHHAQTLGLHLGWPDGETGSEKPRRLFWCVWVLDRLNAAANGRPVLLHRQDMELKMLDTCSEQAAPFRLLIRISRLLDTVISRYRPHSAAVEVEDEVDVTFEHLVGEAKAGGLSSSVLASLEMLYLSVLVLRERPRPTEGQKSQGYPAPSSDLQLFVATSIVSIASEDFKSALAFWPVLPYAVSLAASVAYKSLRNSTLAYRRRQAYSLFRRSCGVLEELGRTFSSARTVALMATDTLNQVERIAADRSRPRLAETLNGGQGTATAQASAVPSPTQGQQDEDQDRLLQQQLTAAASTATSTCQPYVDAPSLGSDEPPNTVEDWVGDAGIFSHFDPSFDLDLIDQVFSANLDPTQPLLSQGCYPNITQGTR